MADEFTLSRGEQRSGWRWLLIPCSLLFPVVGLMVGIWYLPKLDKQDSGLGKACLILGFISLAIYLLACFGLVVLGFGSRLLGEM